MGIASSSMERRCGSLTVASQGWLLSGREPMMAYAVSSLSVVLLALLPAIFITISLCALPLPPNCILKIVAFPERICCQMYAACADRSPALMRHAMALPGVRLALQEL